MRKYEGVQRLSVCVAFAIDSVSRGILSIYLVVLAGNIDNDYLRGKLWGKFIAVKILHWNFLLQKSTKNAFISFRDTRLFPKTQLVSGVGMSLSAAYYG